MEDGIRGDGGVGETKKLSEVVKECVSRWFEETLAEAKAGDIKMQVLVSQMYFNGYGISQDRHKVCFFCNCRSDSFFSFEKSPSPDVDTLYVDLYLN